MSLGQWLNFGLTLFEGVSKVISRTENNRAKQRVDNQNFEPSLTDFRTAIFDELNDFKQQNQQYKREMQGKSDNELYSIIKQYRRSNKYKASAAYQELKSRGHSSEDIKAHI